MRCSALFAALGAALFMTPSSALHAQEPTSSAPQTQRAILPADLLASSAERFPDILASIEREAIARGAELSAMGAFDLVLSAEGFSRTTGFWSGTVVETGARQRLSNTGAEIYGAYRLSDGRFPIYEDEYFTNSLGELKVGALYSLMRNSTIDAERFGVQDTRLATRQATLDVLLTQLIVQHRALDTYWRWVAAGREIEIYQNLLSLAVARQVGIERQFRAGAIPEIALVENEQNLIRRQTLLAEAERNFRIASNALSFYWRDANGQPMHPGLDLLPSDEQLEALPEIEAVLLERPGDILESRPELRSLRIAGERARNTIALRENDLKPQLDLGVELSRDIGSIAEGGSSRDSTDLIVGFTFTVPLQRRAAEGRVAQAEAALREVELREQRMGEELTIELENALVELDAALRIAALAGAEVAQANRMAQAERRRLSLGAGDFFRINVREEDAADAEIRAVRASFAGRRAETRYDAASMRLDKLGLAEPPI
ncbi:MAG: TolC family protein [Pseudomonadota bacterium]